jgi:hypothetical protein
MIIITFRHFERRREGRGVVVGGKEGVVWREKEFVYAVLLWINDYFGISSRDIFSYFQKYTFQTEDMRREVTRERQDFLCLIFLLLDHPFFLVLLTVNDV